MVRFGVNTRSPFGQQSHTGAQNRVIGASRPDRSEPPFGSTAERGRQPPADPAAGHGAPVGPPAWQRCDIEALAALLREDMVLSMPPELIRITGRAQVGRFVATVPADGRLDTISLVRTAANGHPALAAYLPASPPAATDTGSWSSPSPATASPRSLASPAPAYSRGSACP
jgi:hypothetical protein